MTPARHPARTSLARTSFALATALLGACALLAGCQKTTTTTETPSGTTTTTTYSAPSAPAMSASAGAIASSAMAGASDVLGKVETKLDDGALTAKVKTALLAAADVKAMQIDVDSKDGAVTLNGSQETSAAVDRAGVVARGTDGVKSVDNRLVVKAP